MKDAALNFFQLDVQNMIDPIYWALLIAWLGLVATTFASVWGRRLSAVGKIFWSCVILFLPILGLYFYLFYCLFAADYSALERFGLFRRKAQE